MAVPFGKYDLIATLGTGGMADVHLAAVRGPAEFRKLVVIKRLRAEVARVASYTNMLLDEAQIAARLRHPNVVQTFEVGVHEGQHYLAMEYLEGQPVGSVLARGGRPDPACTTRIMADVLAGLEYAHTLSDYDGRPLSIVHRDVSPQNLFVTYSGEVKVVDFGIAKASLRLSEHTEEGVLKGKLAYMAPEQLEGEHVDARTDVFAAGVVMWELLTGRRLFRSESAAEVTRKILIDPIPRPSEICELHPDLEDVCMRALERERSRRWQSAGSMREALYAYMEGGPGRAFRRDELGKYVASLFERERSEVQARIGEFMTGEHRARPDELPSVTVDGLSGVSHAPVATHLLPTSFTGSGAPGPAYAMERPAVAPTPASVPPPRGSWRGALIAASIGAVALVVVAVVAVVMWKRRAVVATPPVDAGAAVELPAPLVTLEGSGTLGLEAAPLMIDGFFKKRGATDVRRQPGEQPKEIVMIATTAHGVETILVRNEGTSGGFDCLGARRCDVAMAAREILDDEARALEAKGLGDLRSPASEHVVALDGVAVVVGPSSPVHALDRAQIADIFSGATTDWSAVGGTPGPIALVAHEAGSGTLDFFDSVVLGGRPLASSAKRMPDNAAIADAVAGQPNAIGFLGMAFVRGARALAVGDRGVAPMIPSAFTVTTERYLLSRRFYFYTPEKPSPVARDFVEYATSPEAQDPIRRAGLVDLEVSLKNVEPCVHCPSRYVAATKNARRMSLDFRFRPGTDKLDARAVVDVERVVRFLHDHPTSRVLLLGFADATGDAKADVRRARELARVVDGELGARGLRASVVEGIGADMPVATNATPWGRTKNRRVEIWVR